MATERNSNLYRDVLFAGPFAGRLDPWAESGRYFHQIHAGLIGAFLEHLRAPLFNMGYFAGREASLQIAAQGDPDLLVRESAADETSWNYEAAAKSVQAESGIRLTLNEPELDAVYIKHWETGDLVTVIEVISPSTKSDQMTIDSYRERRAQLTQEQYVSLVELDLTNSVRRVLNHPRVEYFPYSIAVYLSNDPLEKRLISLNFNTPIKRFALPLRDSVIGVDTQPFYDRAYQHAAIALQIDTDLHYREEELPFPSLLTDQQRQQALTAVATWRNQLTALKNEGSE